MASACKVIDIESHAAAVWNPPSPFNDGGWDVPRDYAGEIDLGIKPSNKQHNQFNPPPDYHEWLKRGRKLCAGRDRGHWNIGDWLVEGAAHFDAREIIGDLPGYLRLSKTTKDDGTEGYKGCHIANYWKDAAAETHTPIAVLRDCAKAARAYSRKERYRGISFSHHLWAAQYDRRHEYMKALFDEWQRRRKECPDARVPSVEWFDQYIRKQEGETEIEPGQKYVRFPVSPEMYAKLKQVSKYKGRDISDIVTVPLTEALKVFLAQAAEKISLAKFGAYEEGQWPFRESRKMKVIPKRRHHCQNRIHDIGFSQKRRTIINASWKRRREMAVAL